MDVGTELVGMTFSELQVDEKWAVREPRGFTWWGSSQATRVWAEPEFEDDGFLITRVNASTDLVRDTRTDTTNLAISTLGRFAAMSGIVRDKIENRLRLQTSMFVHAQSARSVGRIFKLATALQAEEATRLAQGLVLLAGGKVDETAHPRTGLRTTHDDILNVREAVVVPEGRSPSKWIGKEMLQLLKELQTWCLLANGDKKGLTAEFPFREQSSLLRLTADAPHPNLGSGLLALLTLPAGASREERAVLAVKLNGLEVEQMTHADFLGSWSEDDEGVTYVSFVPSVLYAPGSLDDLVRSLAFRAKWAAEGVFGDDWALRRGTSSIERAQAYAKGKGSLHSVLRRVLVERGKPRPWFS
jgi:hypothetical protein